MMTVVVLAKINSSTINIRLLVICSAIHHTSLLFVTWLNYGTYCTYVSWVVALNATYRVG